MILSSRCFQRGMFFGVKILKFVVYPMNVFIEEFLVKGAWKQGTWLTIKPLGPIRACSGRDLLRNINRSDYSHSLEKLHPGAAGNDEALFDPDLPLRQRKGNKLHLSTFTEHFCQK